MPKNMSPANQRQNSKHQAYYARLRTDAVVEQNQMRKLLRHAARQGINYAPGLNVGNLIFHRDGIGYTQMDDAWRRCADVAGIGKARAICAEFALRKGHWA